MESIKKIYDSINEKIKNIELEISKLYTRIDYNSYYLGLIMYEEYMRNDSTEGEYTLIDKLKEEYDLPILVQRFENESSYLSSLADTKEREVLNLLDDLTFINNNDNEYMINSLYSFEEIQQFLEKYQIYFTLEELYNIYAVIKKEKKNNTLQDAIMDIEENALVIDDELNSTMEEINAECVEDISLIAEEVSLDETELARDNLSIDDKLKYLYSLKFIKEDNQSAEEYEMQKEEYCKLIHEVYQKCIAFRHTTLFEFFYDTKNASLYHDYKKSDDSKSLKEWITNAFKGFHYEISFDNIDKIINNIKVCYTFLNDYSGLESLKSVDEVNEFKELFFQENEVISLLSYKKLQELDFTKGLRYSVDDTTKGNSGKKSEQKNILFYTPRCLKNAKDYFEDMKNFTKIVSEQTWQQIQSTLSASPNSNVTQFKIEGPNHRDFTHTDYKKISYEFRLRKIVRVLGSKDDVFEENKKMLKDYFNTENLEIISAHIIFYSNHGGTGENSNNGIGHNGYTPYYNQIGFFRILTKQNAWTKEELDYIIKVIDCCDMISKAILNGEENKIDELQKTLHKVLNEIPNGQTKRGNK